MAAATATASGSRVSYWANRLAVEAEPGLTTTQLMVRKSHLYCLKTPLLTYRFFTAHEP